MSISDVSFASDAISGVCKTLGLQEDIKVISVTNRWRWTLEYNQSAEHPEFTKNMIRVERMLQERLGRPIDLRLESELDKNRRTQRNTLWGPDAARRLAGKVGKNESK